jgi:hypothetical protein
MKVPALPHVSVLALLLLSPLAGAVPARPVPPAEPALAAEPAVEPSPAETATPAPSPAATDDDGDRAFEPRRRHHGKGNTVRLGAGFTLEAGETHNEDIVVLGGPVRIAGQQRGDVVVLGGPVVISGEVDGDIVSLGGPLHLASTARAHRDVVTVGGPLVKDAGATIGGETVEVAAAGGLAHMIPHLPFFGGLGMAGLLSLSILQWLKTAVVALLLALVIAAVLPVRVEAAAGVLRDRWLACLLWGLAAGISVFPLALLLCVTCVGWIVPIAFYQAAKYFGCAALFVVVGEAMGGTGFRRELSLMPSLLLGFLMLSLIGFFVPMIWFVYSWTAAGCALVSRFGTLRPWFGGRTPASPTTSSAAIPASDVATP